MKVRSVVLTAVVALGGLALAVLATDGKREESGTVGTLLGFAGSLSVNDRLRAAVNAGTEGRDRADRNGASPPDAREFVQRRVEELRALVTHGAPPELVTASLDSTVDITEFARRTLGAPCPATTPHCTNHWGELTPEQRAEVTGLLGKLVEKRCREHLATMDEYDVTYRRTEDASAKLAKVRTEAKSKAKPRDPAVQLDFLVMRSGDQYKVVDLVTEGSSTTKNYYDQFHRMLTTPDQGYAFMLTKLTAKAGR